MRPAAVATLLLCLGVLLSGCNGPGGPQADDPVPTVAPAERRSYDVTLVVTRETPDGEPMQAEVHAVPLRADGTLGEPQPRGTDTRGAARYSFPEPTTLLVRVSGPKGWTQEGARIHIDDAVAAAGLTVSDRDVFLPLYQDRLTLATQHAWSTATATVGPDGSVAPATVVAPLAFPDGLQSVYLSRLTDAAVTTRWTDTLDGRVGTLATGLAWDGVAWVVGPESSALGSGDRQASWDGDLPADRPADLQAARLQALLQTGSAVVGDVLFGIEVELRFGGHLPPELPPAPCHLLC